MNRLYINKDWSTLKKLLFLNAAKAGATPKTETLSGSIVTFSTTKAAPLIDCMAEINPVQAGSGDPSPENVRPITGWTGAKVTRTGKNLLDLNRTQGTPSPSNFENTTKPRVMDTSHYYKGITRNNYYSTNSVSNININGSTIKITGSGSGYGVGYPVSVKPNTQYTLSANTENTENGFGYYDANWNFLSFSEASSTTRTITTPSNCEYCLIVIVPKIANVECTISDIQFELGSTATSYSPYTGETVDVQFPAEAGTVYGGTLDVTTGELVVDKVKLSLTGEESPITQGKTGNFYSVHVKADALPVSANTDVVDGISNVLIAMPARYNDTGTASNFAVNTSGRLIVNVYGATTLAEWKTFISNNDVTIVYPLATPLVYHLTPQEITALSGDNTVWADTGDITVTYRK